MPSIHLRKKRSHYYADLYDPARTPKRIYRTLRTRDRRVARQRLVAMEREIALEEYDPWTDRRRDQMLTLSQATALYLAACQREGQAPNTLRTKRVTLGQLRGFLHDDHRLSQVSQQELERFLSTRKGRYGAPPKANTLYSHRQQLIRFFRWLTLEGHLRRSPAERLLRRRPWYESGSLRDLTKNYLNKTKEDVGIAG